MTTPIPIRRNRKRAGPFLPLPLALCVVLAWAVGGCQNKPPAPRPVKKKLVSAPAHAPARPKAGGVEEGTPSEKALLKPVKENNEPSRYHLKSERDPFKSFITVRTAAPASKTKAPRIKTPLQRYSLDQLKVVGIIAGGKMRKALLEDDVGKGYVVSVGDAVGRQGGKITSIRKDRIIIERAYSDVLGNKKVRRITKKLYVSEEGENP